MIYYLTNSTSLLSMPNIEYISLKDALQLINSWEMLQLDVETSGLDPHIDTLLLLQLGDIKSNTQIVIDTTTISISPFKEPLESKYCIGHNLKFDLQWLYRYNIMPLKIYDTMIAEQLKYMGFPHFMIGATEEIIMEYCEFVERAKLDFNWDNLTAPKKQALLQQYLPEVYKFIYHNSGCSLKALANRYLGIELNKSIRAQFLQGTINSDTIVYAAEDVQHLWKIVEKQKEWFHQNNMRAALQIECEAVPALAYVEWCGVHLDQNKWKEKMDKDQNKLNEALAALNEFVINYGNAKYFKRNLQGDLFEGFEEKPICTINWNSTKQVIPFLTLLGFNCKGLDKTTKEEKDSIEIGILKPQRDINPEFFDIYNKYTEAQKVCSTYGQNYINAINPITNRIHTTFRQLGTDTGRLACGSQASNESLMRLKKLSNKDKCAYPQLQNLPSDELTRSCFSAESGNVWISADYMGQESVLLADFSQDQAMLNVFLKGEDMHSTVAYMIFPEEIPRETPINEIKKKYKALRQAAKGPEFCIAYGGNDSTFVRQYGMDPSTAKNIYDNYMKGFPGIAAFQKKQKDFVVKNGYILISPITGHRARWWDWKYWKQVEQETKQPGFWEDYRNNHKGTSDYIAQKIKTHFKAKTKWEKNATNSPLQGTGAIIYKIFSANLFKWIVQNNYFNIIKMCIPVHDELNIEAPIELSEIASKQLENTMMQAGTFFCKTLTLSAESTISTHWIH